MCCQLRLCVNNGLGHKRRVTCCAWSPGAKVLATASLDGTTKLWNSSSFGKSWFRRLRAHELREGWGGRGIHSLSTLPSCTYNFLLHHSRILITEEIANVQNSVGIRTCAYSEDGVLIAIGGHDCSIRIYDTRTLTILHIVSFSGYHFKCVCCVYVRVRGCVCRARV